MSNFGYKLTKEHKKSISNGLKNIWETDDFKDKQHIKHLELLAKQGLRKCHSCKRILKLNYDNFYHEKSDWSGFAGICRECQKIKDSKRQKTESYKKRVKIYNNKNKEKIREKSKTRRLRLRFQIFQRDNFTCQYCGRKYLNVELQIDHKYPASKGGKNKIENYVTSCNDCNLGKSDFILNEFK